MPNITHPTVSQPARTSTGESTREPGSRGGIKWGEDHVRDCEELRRLESWGIYPHGHHATHCPLEHQR